MIIVRVELLSAITGETTELARMDICNIGGDRNTGDYSVQTMRGRTRETLALRNVEREGKVLKHKRLQEHVWNLVAKALNVLEYGK